MDGYEATEKILAMPKYQNPVSTSTSATKQNPRHDDGEAGEGRGDEGDQTHQTHKRSTKSQVTVLAVSADVTDEALERAASVGMEGFMTKPYKLLDLERLIVEYWARKD